MASSKRALVVFSGGQDSTTLLFWAKKKFGNVEAITFNYGQRHSIELECAARICNEQGITQKIVSMDFLSQLSPNALTNSEVAVADDGGFQNLPSTFVPGRNILFLTLAAAYAVPRGIQDIVIGVCQTDFSGYPDCRENFIASMQTSLQTGLDVPGLLVHRPLMSLNKAQTFELAESVGALNDVIEKSHTCYEGDRVHRHAWGYGCGECPACRLRARGYEEFEQARGMQVAYQGDLNG